MASDTVYPASEPKPGPQFPIVAIGASAGGLEALEQFFRNVRPGNGMAYVVIQHLSPDFISLMDQLLARETDLPIEMIEDGLVVLPNQIYLLPPKKEAIVAGGKFVVTDRSPGHALNFPIDAFFRSLAQDAGDRAIAVVLSGTGSDGSRGILDIHANGGLVVSQSRDSAKFDGMPRNACETGVVDLVLNASGVPSALERYIGNLKKKGTEVMDITESAVREILKTLKERYRLDFSVYKSSTIGRRIERRLSLTNHTDIESYAKTVSSDEQELENLYRDLLIGVTEFFRDPTVFERLETDVIPGLVERTPTGGEIRVWVSAVSTGEEAYSFGIVFAEAIERLDKDIRVKIFASDVNQNGLAFASRGIYQKENLTGITPERVKRFFVERTDGFYVAPELRKMIVFTPHDCIRDAPFTKLDLISCRNLLIYLSSTVQRKILSLFHFGLRQDGVLVLGSSETVGDLAEEFQSIDENLRLYRKHRDVTLPVSMRMPLVVDSPDVSRITPQDAQLGKNIPANQLLTTYDQLLEEFMPAGFLINRKNEILHTFSKAGRFLVIGNGRLSSDILQMIHPDLRPTLGAAVRRVQSEMVPVRYTDIRCELESRTEDIDLTVRPISEKNGNRTFLIQLQTREAAAPKEEPEAVSAAAVSNEDFERLERELERSKDSLQSTIEELQVTNEELQATNEQLTSSNEELQSTNEELHSVNEELYTVNAEYQRKIDELTELTDDMDNLLNSTNVHTVFLDADLCIRRFTAGGAKAFNLIRQDVGRRIDSFTNTIRFPELMDEIQNVLENGEPFECEVQDHKNNWYFLRIRPYLSRNRVEGVVITLVEISTLKQAESKLEELSEIVEQSDDAIYRVNVDGTIRTWNRGAVKLYGYEREEVVGESVSVLAPPELRSQPQDYLNLVLKGNSIDHVQSIRQRKNGDRFNVSLTVSSIRNSAKEIAGFSVVARDVTKQKQAEEEIHKAVRRRDQFLAMLSHELRNPLAAVLNATNLLKEERLDVESETEARDVIEHQLRHVARLLDDLLDVSRIANDKVTLHSEVVDVRKLVMDVVDCVQFQIDEKQQALHVDFVDSPVLVEGDVGRLQQAQVNLLVNASKYSPNGAEIHFSLRKENGNAVIHVKDNGHGIHSDLIERIFEPFVQAEQTLDRSQGGMGLGLPLVHMIVTAHGGTVSAYSEGDECGSEFTIRIPLTSKTIGHEEKLTATMSEMKLLLIEDNDGIRKMLARSLELKGFEVATASNGTKGLELCKEYIPGVAVIDIGLPDMNGYEVAKEIRKLPTQPMLVAVTGYGREEDVKKGREAGFDLHLVKPIDPNELLQQVADFQAQQREDSPKRQLKDCQTS